MDVTAARFKLKHYEQKQTHFYGNFKLGNYAQDT